MIIDNGVLISWIESFIKLSSFLFTCLNGFAKRFKVICLNDNIPALLAIANDISYDDVFVEQLKNFVNPGDVVVGFSGSGNSKNIVRAIEYANVVDAETVAFCGFTGGKIKRTAKHSLHVCVDDMEVVQDLHLVLVHCIKRTVVELIKQEERDLQKFHILPSAGD